jgi:hypothetical protein
MAGYCNAGKCRPSMCSSYSYGGSSLDFCGVDKTNICRENCFNTNVDCQYFSPVDVADGVPCNKVKGTCQSGFCETPQTCGDGVKHSTEECDTGGDTACCRGCKLMFECDGLDATCCSNCRFQVCALPRRIIPSFPDHSTSFANTDGLNNRRLSFSPRPLPKFAR